MSNQPKPKPTAKPKAAAKGRTVKVKTPEQPKRPRGRPSKPVPVPQDLAEEIVRRISDGETLRSICRSEHMPTWRAIYDWMEKDPLFAARIARARELGEDAISQECMDIADDTTGDEVLTENGPRPNTEFIQRSKLRIETRLKLLAKWNPKKWGDKVDLNHGVQPENPLAELFTKVAGTPIKPKG
jgi:hypothetical protein